MGDLLSAPRWVSARITPRGGPNDVHGWEHSEWYLLGTRSAWVVLDAKPNDPRRSRYRYNRRLLIARVDRAGIPADAACVEWVWDRKGKPR